MILRLNCGQETTKFMAGLIAKIVTNLNVPCLKKAMIQMIADGKL